MEVSSHALIPWPLPVVNETSNLLREMFVTVPPDPFIRFGNQG